MNGKVLLVCVFLIVATVESVQHTNEIEPLDLRNHGISAVRLQGVPDAYVEAMTRQFLKYMEDWYEEQLRLRLQLENKESLGLNYFNCLWPSYTPFTMQQDLMQMESNLCNVSFCCYFNVF